MESSSSMEIEDEHQTRLGTVHDQKPIYFNYNNSNQSFNKYINPLYLLGSPFLLKTQCLPLNFIKQSKQLDFEQLVLNISRCIIEQNFNPDHIRFTEKSQKIDNEWSKYIQQMRIKHKEIQSSHSSVLDFIRSDMRKNSRLLQILGSSSYLVDDYYRDRKLFQHGQEQLERRYRPTRHDIKTLEFEQKQQRIFKKQKQH
ncbi:hypothetical protein SS50377_20191 [Spironucleus salmonicida]|uniref:Uncharacterized protein n=1 Tax=Spironucleus salmonicida TaxID=348837 RepID=V6LNF3_9EUKA|nr:hypothetical protein SS50377_20191 [Spironucleus salmonicida]|eukprot:EST45246.1 Hypothetical protein SS50377_14822 [Spironucleus salmonicida]